jgi:hypothetical protein
MTAPRDLERLYPALSAKERVLLILRAWKAGEDHDPQIRYTIPTKQTYEYNRLIALVRGASGDLSHYIVLVAQLVEQLSLRWCWLASLHLGALNACQLAESALAATHGKEKAALRRALKPTMTRFAVSLYGDPRWGKADGRQRMTGDVVAEGLVEGIREMWPQRWRELRASEIIVAEIAEEFDGEDPLHIEVRELLEKCRADLLDLQDLLERYTGKLAQEEPEEALLVRLREIVRNG